MSDAKPFATMSHEGAGPYLWMEDIQFQAYAPDGNPFKAMDKINAAVASLVAAARKEERERCAKIAEEANYADSDECAAAIRAIGE